MTVRILHGDALEQLQALPAESVHSIVTDPPYGLEFMGKEWDSFAPRDRKNASVWDGRRESSEGWEEAASARSGRGGGGPSYNKSQHKGAKRCVTCGKRAFSGSPCQCETPEWILEHRQEAPSAMLAFQAWCEAWARECYRVLKPGGHLLSFGGSRTYHRMACAIEDAGFEIRDQIMWVYGSGFPKSLDVSKAIDKAAGAERPIVARRTDGAWSNGTGVTMNASPAEYDYTAPATESARQWQGWGTALKPAHEPIVVARKPLIGTVAANVFRHGTGAINIDGCRVDSGERPHIERRNDQALDGDVYGSGINGSRHLGTFSAGRWPANIIHDGSDEVLAGFPWSKDGIAVGGNGRSASIYGTKTGGDGFPDQGYGTEGSAARFFYTAKSSSDDRNIGSHAEDERNHHPTVKPTDLMQYLVRLVTPPGGTVLDPFAGSGSTGLAADREGFDAILIEREAEYVEIARRRIVGDCPLFAEIAA